MRSVEVYTENGGCSLRDRKISYTTKTAEDEAGKQDANKNMTELCHMRSWSWCYWVSRVLLLFPFPCGKIQQMRKKRLIWRRQAVRINITDGCHQSNNAPSNKCCLQLFWVWRAFIPPNFHRVSKFLVNLWLWGQVQVVARGWWLTSSTFGVSWPLVSLEGCERQV